MASYLEKKIQELHALPPNELREKGIEARKGNEGEEEREVEKIKGEYKVQ